MMTVTVIIPVFNARRTLDGCLRALACLTPPPDQIILVDNGSTDGSVPLLHAFAGSHTATDAHVLQELRLGAAAARNAGIRQAKGDVVAFTDADCVPDPLWLQHVTGPFSDPAVGAVAGRVVAAPATSTLELFSALYTLQLPKQPARRLRWTPREGGYPTANLAVRRHLLEELGGFDERVGIYGEDYDLCARLYTRGHAIAYVPAAQVSHHHRTTLAGMFRQAFGFGRSHPYLLRTHAERGLWLDLPRRPLAWPGCPIRAWVDLGSADKKALLILAAGSVYPPALWLLPLYAGWLALLASRRARHAGSPVSAASAVILAGMLLLKSAAMTAGRWWGSLKYGVLCL